MAESPAPNDAFQENQKIVKTTQEETSPTSVNFSKDRKNSDTGAKINGAKSNSDISSISCTESTSCRCSRRSYTSNGKVKGQPKVKGQSINRRMKRRKSLEKRCRSSSDSATSCQLGIDFRRNDRSLCYKKPNFESGRDQQVLANRKFDLPVNMSQKIAPELVKRSRGRPRGSRGGSRTATRGIKSARQSKRGAKLSSSRKRSGRGRPKLVKRTTNLVELETRNLLKEANKRAAVAMQILKIRQHNANINL